ncbi:MAG: DUF2254 domain-containing protein [Blastochloris sp.]|nr:DUF2254 domain-containing protein [Blastochloris sp.]
MNKLKLLWSNLRSSLWFIPTLIVAASIMLAVAVIDVDSHESDLWLAQWPRLFGAGAEGARGMLSTIAGSMMSVVGVTFSMTLVALAMASSQYTSRILRNFMSSRVTQSVLGIFSGIFTYCLIVLRTIRGGDEGVFVPNLAVFLGFVLAVGGVGLLIFFIHHVASSIQASSIIASVANETVEAIDRLFPKQLARGTDEDPDDLSSLPPNGGKWQTVPALKSGYIQSVDNSALLRLAREQKTVVRMERGIGEFVVENTALASLSLENPPSAETTVALQATFNFSSYRTLEQDAAFGIRQIVDVALKALSPGVNDTTTAVTCVDYLTVILARLATKHIPASHRYEDGALRVIAVGPSFQSLLSEAFDQIREGAKGNLSMMLRMLDSVRTIASLTSDPSRRQALHEQVEWITELAKRSTDSPHDRSLFEGQLVQVRKSLKVDLILPIHEEPKEA